MNWTKFMDWLKQPSTLKALVLAAGMAGINISPEMQNKIMFVGGVIYAGLGRFTTSSRARLLIHLNRKRPH